MAVNKDDIDIAYSAVMVALFKSGGVEQMMQTVQGVGDPIKGIASVIYTTLAAAREQAQAQIDFDPNIWLSPGGVVDRVTKDVCEIAAANGIQGADSKEFGIQVKREVVNMMKAEDMGAQQGTPPQTPGAPQGLLAQAGGPPEQMPPMGVPMNG